MENKAERIEGWLCTETDGLRGASHGEESASYQDGVLMAFGKIPQAVLAWLTRPPATVAGHHLGSLFRPDGDLFVAVGLPELPRCLSAEGLQLLAGLVRAAELLEGRDIDQGMSAIWDTRASEALQQARAFGWALGKLEASAPPEPPAPPSSFEPPFEDELAGLINRYCLENGSNTPDFILASYLKGCLDNWNAHSKKREAWYGTTMRPGGSVDGPTAVASHE